MHGLEERGGQQAEESYQQLSVNQQTLTGHHLWASPQMQGEKKINVTVTTTSDDGDVTTCHK